jgi:hypothetical protein
MSAIGGPQHEKTLDEYIQALRLQGWRVIKTEGKCPDAIAVKDGKVVAVECEGRYKRKGKRAFKGYRIDSTFALKRKQLSMFDDVMFVTFYRD